MSDLILGILFMLALSVGLFFAGRLIAARVSPWVGTVLVAGVAGFLIAFVAWWWDDVRITRLLPLSNVIVTGNFQPPAVGLLAGLSSRLVPGRAWRKLLLLTPLVVIGLWRAYHPLLEPPPRVGSYWQYDVCMQTSESTCSPAAAATLLCAYGIPASEAEMAELCLTSERGTTMHGLWRGLVLKTEGTKWRPEAFRTDVPTMRALLADGGPAVLTVGIRPDARVDSRYATQWGWTPGLKHSVVLFGFINDQRVSIADPNIGREQWSVENLNVLFHGEGIRLVRRE